MSHQTICESLHNVISSPGLVSGHMPYVALGGPMIARRGRHHAHANLSARQAKEKGLLTSGTYGPPHIGLSGNAILSWYLANNLEALTRMAGSTLYKLTWKPWAMPSGRSRFRLRASARRTSEIARIGWPTPTAAAVAGPGASGRQGGMNIQTAATLAHWPTPLANDAKGSDYSTSRGEKILKLGGAAKLAGWVTPTARDWKDTAGMTATREGKERLDQLPRQAFTCQPLRLTVFGVMLTGSTAVMKNGGQLNPAHSRWLMGLPRAWDECSPMWSEWQAATEEAA